MPVKIVTGNLFTYPAPAIAHGCNTRGVMGAGVADIVRNEFPEAYTSYRKLCVEADKNHPSLLGMALPVRITRMSWHTKWVVNLFTQVEPGPYATIDAIGEAVGRLVEWAEGERVGEVAIPAIGAGIGGLSQEWPEVLEAIVEAVADSLVTITIVRLP